MSRPRILAISYLFPNREQPNHGIFVLNRLRAMSQYADITVINPIPWSPLHRFFKRYRHYSNLPEKDELQGLTVYHPRFLSIPKVMKSYEGDAYYKAILPVAKTLFDETKFDIVDMHWTFPDLPAGIKLAKIYGVPTCVTLRGLEALHKQDNDQRADIVEAGLKEFDQIVALSEELKIAGDQASGAPEKSVVIRNGVDTDNFVYMPKQSCREKLGLSEHEKIIIAVGSLIHRKGFDLIIDVLPNLLASPELRNTKLYIIGSQGAEGDYRTALFAKVKQLGLSNNVIFVGQVPNNGLPFWYNAADVFCLASRGEGSPNVLTEALACGCPAVTTDVGAAKEIVLQKPELGVWVKPDDKKDLQKGLEEVLHSNYPRQENSEYLKQFNWDWCARKVLDVLGRTVSK